ncbi:UNVERIFIED_CONTAM: Isoamylase 1, chloroplastic [Sesamum calycinum]|uniref:Isoamylase 1, chloroplastic n=1 Tax=Sesamum calycinum TaxID=2727403 RepID=A0AAW2NVQ8_9LAMI
MHVRGFTRHESSNSKFPGTYRGVVEKLDHLKKLGINCIELMPCHEFNELEYYSYNSVLGDYKVNFWGYSTISYFSPMARYASAGIGKYGLGAVNEFKYLVREAHKRGIEVIMDVVFNHTAEGNENGPILSFRGLDNSVFYMLAPKGEFYNYSGCGTFNCNHPIVRQFILDCLRYWVTEMHVDGFRFDLASILTRSSSLWDAVNVYGDAIEGEALTIGTPLSSPPLIDMISNDPILHGVKLIAEAWDCGGLYQVGMFPHWGIWSEWNGKYRDIVRQFIKGTDGFAGAFAECLCGSPNLYQEGGRKPWNSINFVCAHDGFTLADLVTYNNKHNLANGEDNKDGENHNNSWNCGQGVPMIYMGDEYGHTKGGNNNTYCHDNFINYFRWDKMEEAESDFFRYCCLMTKFRRECESLGLNDFPTAERLQWHGHTPATPDWSDTSRFVAFTLIDSVKGELYIAFNASHIGVTVALPERPGYRWEPLVDTGKAAPYDFLSDDLADRDTAMRQLLKSFQFLFESIVLKMKRRKDVEDVSDDFAEFSLSPRSWKIPRLDAELPPIPEEEETDVPVAFEQSQPRERRLGSNVIRSSKAHELRSGPEDEERAIMLFEPINTTSNFSVSVDPDLISGLKDQVLWSNKSNSLRVASDEALTEDRDSSSSNGRLAVVPWVAPQFVSTPRAEFPCQFDKCEMMDAEELGEATMDVEDDMSNEHRNANEAGGITLNEGAPPLELHGQVLVMRNLSVNGIDAKHRDPERYPAPRKRQFAYFLLLVASQSVNEWNLVLMLDHSEIPP